MSAAPPLKKNPHHGQAAAVTSRNSRKPLLLIAPSTDIVSPARPAPNFSNVLALRVGFPDLRAMCLASCVGTGAMSWPPTQPSPTPMATAIATMPSAASLRLHGCREPDPFLV